MPGALKRQATKVQDYLQDKAMDHLLRNTIIYNVAWEVACRTRPEPRIAAA